MNTPNFSFPKKAKLKGYKNIETLFQNGKAFFVHPFRVVFLLNKKSENLNSHFQVGVGAPKRNIKLATQRNTIKRQTREAFRLQQHAILPLLQQKNICLTTMIIFSTNNTNCTYTQIEIAMKKILQKLNQEVEAHQ